MATWNKNTQAGDPESTNADFMRWFIERFDAPDQRFDQLGEQLTELKSLVLNLGANQQATINHQGELMAKLDQVNAAVDANTAQANKAFGEIRAALDKALESQITPAELTAAVDAAKAAQKAEDDTASEAALDGVMTKLTDQQAALQQLDNIVPDAPVTGEPV